MSGFGDAWHREKMAEHARTRLEERCCVRIPRYEYDLLCAAIRAGDLKCVAATRRGDPVYRARLLAGERVYAVWSLRLGLIATFIADLCDIDRHGGRLLLPSAPPARRAHPRPGSERATAGGARFVAEPRTVGEHRRAEPSRASADGQQG